MRTKETLRTKGSIDRPFLVSSGATPTGGFSAFDGDHSYVSEGRRIGDNIRNIRRFALEVNSKNMKKSQLDPKTVHSKVIEAQSLATETKNLLDNFGEVMGVSDAEKVQKRLMHHSLSRQFEMVLIFLEDCIASYESYQHCEKKAPEVPSESGLRNQTVSTGSTLESPTTSESFPDTNQNETVQFLAMKDAKKLETAIWEEKTKEIAEAHEDLQAIRSLCRDLLGQIEYQGNDLNAIESQIESTVELTDTSVGHLRSAYHLHFQSYKIWFIIGVIGVLLLIVLILSMR